MNSYQANMLMRNSPKDGPLKDRWTGEQLDCPVCGSRGLDKFIGGPDVQKGSVNRTEFIYHCRVCDLNLTEQDYKEI